MPMISLYVEGASVNTEIQNGLAAKMKASAPWLNVVYCFNHNPKLAVKDAFDKTFFK